MKKEEKEKSYIVNEKLKCIEDKEASPYQIISGVWDDEIDSDLNEIDELLKGKKEVWKITKAKFKEYVIRV